MDTAVTQLAWDKDNEDRFLSRLDSLDICKVEAVFSMIKPWQELCRDDIVKYKSKLDSYGLTAYSAQSLFYELNYSLTDVDLVVKHFERLKEYSSILGTQVLVFGSPSMRKRNQLASMTEILKQVDDLLQDTNMIVVLEPNSTKYNAEFFNSLTEIVSYLEEYQFTNIGTMIDTHNIELERGDFSIDFCRNIKYIDHVHVSEIGLKPIQYHVKHKIFRHFLETMEYKGTVTYEVLKSQDTEKSVHIFSDLYC